ncbi:MAG: hypothetical protein ABI875_08820, partial [Gemmatimonadales bacterium]
LLRKLIEPALLRPDQKLSQLRKFRYVPLAVSDVFGRFESHVSSLYTDQVRIRRSGPRRSFG